MLSSGSCDYHVGLAFTVFIFDQQMQVLHSNYTVVNMYDEILVLQGYSCQFYGRYSDEIIEVLRISTMIILCRCKDG